MRALSSQWYDFQDQAAVAASCWRVSGLNGSPDPRTSLASGSGPEAALFGDVDMPAVLALVKNSGDPSPVQLEGRLDTSEAFLMETHPGAACLWRHVAAAVGSWRSADGAEPGCLIVVRQPLKARDPVAQRDWVRTVLRALETDPAPPPGLCSATFFATPDGSHILNFAGWTSAEAHRVALGSAGRKGSIGITPEWAAVRAHPDIQAEHEVRRFTLFADEVSTQPDDALSSSVQSA